MLSFRQRLVQAVVQLDIRQSLSEHRRGQPVDALRLPRLLDAAAECANAVEQGGEPESAFEATFPPTPIYRHMAQQLGLCLDIRQDQWIRVEDIRKQPRPQARPSRRKQSGEPAAPAVHSPLQQQKPPNR